MHVQHIRYSSCNSNLLCCRVFEIKEAREALCKQCWHTGFHPAAAGTGTNPPQPSQLHAADFSHLKLVSFLASVGFPSRP